MARVCPECEARYDDAVGRCPRDGAVTLAVDADDGLIGRSIGGRFDIVEPIGRGGMGTVYRARQLSMDRDVAIKFLRRELASSEQEVLRFFREARAASLLSSPHTITVFDFGQTEDGQLYIVMELLRGESLAAHLKRHPGPMEWRRALSLCVQVLEALVQAHGSGVLHRDLKPDNIFLVRGEGGEDFVKVLDFGIAKIMGADSSGVTAAGLVIGTPMYMSPEQALGVELDARSDLYSTGVVLFELLAGRTPFVADSPMALAIQKVNEKAPSIRRVNGTAKVPAAVEKAVARLLSREPEHRPADARAARRMLLDLLGGPAGTAEPAPSRREAPEPGPEDAGPSRPVTRPGFALFDRRRRERRIRLGLGLAIVGLVALGLGAAWLVSSREGAQDGASAPPGSPSTAPVASSPAAGPPGIAPPPADVPRHLEPEVRAVFDAVAGRREADAAAALARLGQARAVAQIADLTGVAGGFLHAFRPWAAELPDTAAARLAQAAVDLAPDLPDLRFELARRLLSAGSPWQAAKAAVAGLKAFGRYPRGRDVARANLAGRLALVLVFLLAFVPVALLARHAPRLLHDLGHLFRAAQAPLPGPAGRTRLETWLRRNRGRLAIAAAALLFVLAPLAGGLGVPGSALACGLLASPYVTRAQAVALVAAFAAALAIGPLSARVSLPETSSSGPAALPWTCFREYCPEASVDALPAASPPPGWTVVAGALRLVHEGPLSAPALTEAEQRLAAGPLDESGAGATLLGNARLLRALAVCTGGRPDAALVESAVASYQSALRTAPASEPALRGLAVAEALLGRRAASREAAERIAGAGADPEEVGRLLSLPADDRACARATTLAGELRPPAPWDAPAEVRDGPPLPVPGDALLLGALAPAHRVFPALAACGLLAIALVARRRLDVARLCDRCRTVSCDRCRSALPGTDDCPTCRSRQLLPAFVDPVDVNAIVLRRESRSWLLRQGVAGLGLLVPGAAQVIGGRPVRGLALLLLAGIGATLLAFPAPPVVDVGGYRGPGDGFPVLAAVLLGVAYLASTVEHLWRSR